MPIVIQVGLNLFSHSIEFLNIRQIIIAIEIATIDFINTRSLEKKTENSIPRLLKTGSFAPKYSGRVNPFNPNIPFNTLIASSQVVALKNTHAIFTKLNVINHAANLFNLKPRVLQYRLKQWPSHDEIPIK